MTVNYCAVVLLLCLVAVSPICSFVLASGALQSGTSNLHWLMCCGMINQIAGTICTGGKIWIRDLCWLLSRASGTHWRGHRAEAFCFITMFGDSWCQKPGFQKSGHCWFCHRAGLSPILRASHSSDLVDWSSLSCRMYTGHCQHSNPSTNNSTTHLFSLSYYWFPLETFNLKITFSIQIIFNISIKPSTDGSLFVFHLEINF